jgi:hypothetical protein
MKIQCNCGTKYAFDVTPDMAANPVRFVCQKCGLDSSEVVNQLIRQELGVPISPPAPVPAPAPVAVAAPPKVSVAATSPPAAPRIALAGRPPAPAAASASTPPPVAPAPAVPAPTLSTRPAPPTAPAPESVPPLRVAAHGPAEAGGHSGAASATAAPTRPCGKHPGQDAGHHCLVCQKPMCPLCMRVTGLVCSPFCRTKAEAQGMTIPEYGQQRDVADRRRWRKVASVAGGIAAVLLLGFGFWFWYAWFGCVPKVAYAHRYEYPGFSGGMHLAAQQQLVILHGGLLERHDLVSGRIVWSVSLIDRERIARDSIAELEQMKKDRDKAIQEGADRDSMRLPTLDSLTKGNIRAAAAEFALQVSGENIWLVTGEKLIRHSWADGKAEKEVAIHGPFDEPVRLGEELLFVGFEDPERSLRVDLTSGDTKATEPAKAAAVMTGRKSAAGTRGAVASVNPGATSGGTSGQARPATLNSASLATRVQNLPMPNRLALPATVASAENQRRAQAMMNDEDDEPILPRPIPRAKGATPPEVLERIRTRNGVIEFATRLLEEKIVTREAMKAAPKKSALEGTVNAAATTAIANELLNEMQRDRVGSTVEEDLSRYQVTVRRPGQSAPAWTGEIIGPPSLHQAKSVDIITGAKGLVVLDRNNKKLWDGALNYPVAGRGEMDGLQDLEMTGHGRLSTGAGPCVERGDTLYVFDEGVLTSFALADGNVRWRLPSVGIAGLWFDQDEMLYVNTTTASPDSIKYSKQIDIATTTHSQVLKVDPKTGQTLWKAQNEGMITYIWDKYIYTAESHAGDDGDEEEALLGMRSGLEIPAHVRIKRLSADNGRVVWQHYQPRYPLDVHFDRNTIQFLFKKEVQHLRFITL